MFPEYQPQQRDLPKSYCLQKRKRRPALQYIPQHNHPEAKAPQKQSKTAQDGENGEISVLHYAERSKAVGGRSKVEANILQALIHRLYKVGARGFRIDQKRAVPALRRE